MNRKKTVEKMSILGIGPILLISSTCYGFLMVYFEHKFSLGYLLDFLSQYATFTAGDIFLFIGFVILVKSVIVLKEARQKGTLALNGVYCYMRHPIYKAWIFFILPGIAIIARSLFFLTVPLFAYTVYKCLIEKEEVFLARRFGPAYLDWISRKRGKS